MFLDGIIPIIRGILCYKYLFPVETRAFANNSSSSSMPSVFKRGHEAKCQKFTTNIKGTCSNNNSQFVNYFSDRELTWYLHGNETSDIH